MGEKMTKRIIVDFCSESVPYTQSRDGLVGFRLYKRTNLWLNVCKIVAGEKTQLASGSTVYVCGIQTCS